MTKSSFILLLFAQLGLLAQTKVPSQILNQTWDVESPKWFTGVTVVFVETEFKTTKAIWQYNGSGLPVIGCEVLDVRISNDSIILTAPDRKEILVYSESKGLFYDKKPLLKSSSDQPFIYLMDPELRIWKNCSLLEVKFYFQSETAYYQEKWYQITK